MSYYRVARPTPPNLRLALPGLESAVAFRVVLRRKNPAPNH